MERDTAAVRIAATVLIVRDDPFEVLMVRRHSESTFASALVFPGGVIEADDRDEAWDALTSGGTALDPEERAIRIGGIRETFEETGILIGAERQPTVSDIPFRSIVESVGAVLPLDEVIPFAHWVTPAVRLRRFDTYFLLARAPEQQIAVADGAETVDAIWISPADAAAQGESGESIVLFPTLMNLFRLAESPDVASAFAAARAREHFAVEGSAVQHDDGSMTIDIPAEAGYAVTSYHQRPVR